MREAQQVESGLAAHHLKICQFTNEYATYGRRTLCFPIAFYKEALAFARVLFKCPRPTWGHNIKFRVGTLITIASERLTRTESYASQGRGARSRDRDSTKRYIIQASTPKEISGNLRILGKIFAIDLSQNL